MKGFKDWMAFVGICCVVAVVSYVTEVNFGHGIDVYALFFGASLVGNFILYNECKL